MKLGNKHLDFSTDGPRSTGGNSLYLGLGIFQAPHIPEETKGNSLKSFFTSIGKSLTSFDQSIQKTIRDMIPTSEYAATRDRLDAFLEECKQMQAERAASSGLQNTVAPQ